MSFDNAEGRNPWGNDPFGPDPDDQFETDPTDPVDTVGPVDPVDLSGKRDTTDSYSREEIDSTYTALSTNVYSDLAIKTGVYSIDEVDILLGGIDASGKRDIADSYSHEEIDSTFAALSTNVYTDLASKTEVYTIEGVDLLLDYKVNRNETYTGVFIEDRLADKPHIDDVYSKLDANILLDGKHSIDAAYTKLGTDDLLITKAAAANVYTSDQVDGLLGALVVGDPTAKTEKQSGIIGGQFKYPPIEFTSNAVMPYQTVMGEFRTVSTSNQDTSWKLFSDNNFIY
jgi:hypothetical protein